MDKEFRKEEIKLVNKKAIRKTILPDLEREYSLNEIAIITRAGPARALGLSNKGHLRGRRFCAHAARAWAPKRGKTC